MDKKVLRIVCGFSNEESASIREKLTEAAAKRDLELSFISRYRKEGVYQYLQEHEDYNIVVLQEILQNSSPYTAEDLAELEDIRNLNVIISLNKNHYGDRYMRILYAAGITNALYEEDASAEKIINLMLNSRNRKSCRQYYGIKTLSDVEQILNIVDQNRIDKYADYILNGGSMEGAANRYKFSVERLNSAENMELVGILPAYLREELTDFPQYQRYFELAYGKKHWFRRKKKSYWKRNRIDTDMQEAVVPESRPKTEESDLGEPERRAMEEKIQGTAPDEYEEFKPEAEELLEEDISDLLGFQKAAEPKREKNIDETAKPRVKKEPVPVGEFNKIQKNRETNGVKKSKKPFIILGVLVSVLIFLVIGIFLLLGPYRHMETEQPAVRQGSVQQETDAGTQAVANDKQSKKPATKSESKKPKDTDSGDSNPKTDSKDNKEKSKSTEKLDEPDTQEKQQPKPVAEPVQDPQPGQQTENQADISLPDTDSGQSNVVVETGGVQEIPPVSPTQPPSSAEDYNGKIFTGGEVADIAGRAEAAGKSIYLRTRTDGEGFFSAAEAAGIVDGTCSYLAQVNGEQITFIEQ